MKVDFQNLLTLSDHIVREVRAFGPTFPLWRFRSSSKCGLTKIRCGENTYFIRKNASDPEVLFHNLVMEEYKIRSPFHFRKLTTSYNKILDEAKQPLIIDAGGNIGLAASWFAQNFPQALIVSIEPDPDSAKIARLNTKSFPHVVVLEAAIGGAPGYVSLSGPKSSWATETERSDSGIRIFTVDEIQELYPLSELLIVKVDIEGFESDLFASNVEWADRAKCIYVEIHDWLFPERGSSASFQASMLGKGKDIIIQGDNIVLI